MPADGGRGIRIEWDDYAQFIADMGPRPTPKHTVERLDNDGPYCAANCAWRTRQEQANNRRDNHRVTFAGKTLTIAEWARDLGVKYNTLAGRLPQVARGSADRGGRKCPPAPRLLLPGVRGNHRRAARARQSFGSVLSGCAPLGGGVVGASSVTRFFTFCVERAICVLMRPSIASTSAWGTEPAVAFWISWATNAWIS